MLLKSLLKLLLLGALSAGASSLPGMLGRLPGLPGGKIPGLPAAGASDESSAELSRELADLQGTMAELRSLGNAQQSVAGLSSEERELMQDAAPKLKFKSNKLTRQLGLVSGKGFPTGGGALPGAAGKIISRFKNGHGPEFQNFSDLRKDLLKFYGRHQAVMAYAFWLAPAAAVVLSFLLFLVKRYTLSMMITGLLFALSNFFIWAFSAAIVLSTLLTKQSLLASLPPELWISPVLFLVVSAGMLRLADENYPFWNKTIATLFTPIAASCMAAGWLHGAGFLKGLLGPATAL
jgi:hypothetical protein